MKNLLMVAGILKVIGVSFIFPIAKIGISLFVMFIKIMFGLMVAIIFSAK